MIIEGQQLALLVFLPTKLIWAIYRKEKRKEWDKKKKETRAEKGRRVKEERLRDSRAGCNTQPNRVSADGMEKFGMMQTLYF